jgi:hypothetical protein
MKMKMLYLHENNATKVKGKSLLNFQRKIRTQNVADKNQQKSNASMPNPTFLLFYEFEEIYVFIFWSKTCEI